VSARGHAALHRDPPLGRCEPVARPRHRGPRRGRDRAGRRDGPRDPAADLPGRRGGGVRLYPPGQPAVARPAHRELPHRRRRGAHPDPVRVLRPAGPGPASEHAGPGAPDAQPGAGDTRRGADDVRRADPPLGGGGGRGAAELPGAGVPGRDSPIGETVRGANLWTAHHFLCAGEPRGRGLRGTGERGDRNWRDDRGCAR